jgi:glycosyltransferase involved in cell wall biosynthesis
MRRMRAVIVNRLAGIHRGGGEIYDLCLAAALQARGSDVSIITGSPLLSPPPCPVTGVPAHYVRSPYLRGLAHRLGRAGWRVFDYDLHRFERGAFDRIAGLRPAPDVIQVTGLPDLAVRVQRETRFPVALLFPGPPSPRHKASILECRTVVGVGAVTPYLEERFRQDVHDMTAGVDAGVFRPDDGSRREAIGITDGEPVILYAGRLVPLKNLGMLVDAFARIRSALPRARLLVVGDGPMRSDIVSRAAKAGLTNGSRALVMAGEVPHERMPGYYATADLLVLTSLNESFSLVALEAMACGRCVLAPAVGYLPRLIEDGVTGSLYPAGDLRAFVEKAILLLEDPDQRARMGAAARETALRRHSWEAVAAEFESLYRRMTST